MKRPSERKRAIPRCAPMDPLVLKRAACSSRARSGAARAVVHDGFDQKFPSSPRECNPVCDRDSNHEQNEADHCSQSQTQPNCRPVHRPVSTGEKPYSRRSELISLVFRNSRKRPARFLCCEFLTITAACSNGGYKFCGITKYLPSPFIPGPRTSDSAIIPTSAFPDCTNCAVCAMFSPNTSLEDTLSHKPALLSAASAARP